MDKDFHTTAPVIALKFMPKEFVDFLICNTYSLEQLQIDADISDLVDKDNITINAEIHHSHSYKLEEKEDDSLHWIDGDCLERLKGLCTDTHDFKVEGKLDMARYCLGKMTHYKIDSLTYPHLHRAKPWSTYHTKFEDELGEFINKHKDEIEDISPTPYKDIYKDCRKTTLDMWYKGKDVVSKYENKISLTDEEKLEICKICVQGIVDLWTTLGKELKIIK